MNEPREPLFELEPEPELSESRPDPCPQRARREELPPRRPVDAPRVDDGPGALIVEALRYPLRGKGPWMLVIGGVVSMLADIAGVAGLLGLLAGVVVAAFFAAYFWDILQDSLAGRDELPDWPSFDEELSSALLRMWAVILFCAGPLAAWLIAAGELLPRPLYVAGGLGLYAYGMVVFPMTALSVFVNGSVRDGLPHVVIPAIARCGVAYFLVVVASALALAPLVLFSEALEEVLVLGWFVAGVLWIYDLAVTGRVLGRLYLSLRTRIG